MPCRSDYMEPTAREKSRQETAQLLTFVLNRLGRPIPDYVSVSAAQGYGEQNLDHLTDHLCSLIRALTPEQQASIVYDGRSAMSRRLADWWEHHEAADRLHVAEEARLDRIAERARLTLSELHPDVRREVIEAIKLGLVK